MPTPTEKKLDKNSVILLRPLVTEKSTAGVSASDNGGRPCYTFVVKPNANKLMVRRAIIEQYKVTPTKININVMKGRKFFARGKTGAQSGFKKALVYLKSGDKIEL
ncbi:MAG: 50S ribosomal protein L23 [Candidatus Vogelbacteria bacterium]